MTTSTKCRQLDELVQLYLYVCNYTDSTLVRFCELKENIFIFLTKSEVYFHQSNSYKLYQLKSKHND